MEVAMTPSLLLVDPDFVAVAPDSVRVVTIGETGEITEARLGVPLRSPGAFGRALRVVQHSPLRTHLVSADRELVNVARAAGLGASLAGDLRAARQAIRAIFAVESVVAAEVGSTVVLAFYEEDDAAVVAGQLGREARKELLAGEDDADDAQWLITLPLDGNLAELRKLADEHNGFAYVS
jgi:putative hydrolase of the HAD superfamily